VRAEAPRGTVAAGAARKGADPLRVLIAIGVSRQKEAGAAGVVLSNASELAKRGHTVECWFLEDVLDRPAKPKRFEALFFAMALARRILRERRKFDVVNLHAPWGCVYGVGRHLFRPAGAPPYVMTMQGSEERFVEAMRCEQHKGRAWHFGWKNRLWHRIYHQTMYNISISCADYGTVANSESLALTKINRCRNKGRFSYVPNGTEERFFQVREYPEKSSLRLLYVGAWLDRKGIYYLAEAFEHLARKLPGIELTVAGCLSSEESVSAFFTPEVRARVRVLPFLGRSEMPALYAAHDIFLFPSLMEGMPLTLLEAMAAGMPAATTNTCGMADVVENEVNGLLVPPADGEALARAIERLCNSADLRKRLGQSAQETMRRYTWEKVTGKLERVLFFATQEAQSAAVDSAP
jgi:glycosyltransferase involved in cell wall biosynthesis